MARLRICIVTHLYPVSDEDYKGVFVHEIASALAGRGHVVHVVTPRRPGAKPLETRDGVRIHRFRHWGWWRGRQLGQLKGTPPLMLGTLMICGAAVCTAIVLRHRLRLVYAYWVVPGGFLAWFCARLTGRPAVVTAAGSDLNAAAGKAIFRPFVTRTLRGVDQLIACGSDLRATAIALGADPERTTVLPSLVALPNDSADPPAALAGEAGARLLYVGNLTPPKRVDTLLRAMARVVAERPGACLTVVGDGELEGDLRRLAAELGLGEGSVRMLGRRPHAEIAGMMRGADLLLHCSDHEGLPVAIHEALAAGLPVVAAGVGGIPDLVADGVRGILLRPDDAAGFARAILDLTGDARRRAAMSKAALQFAADHLAREAIIGKIEDVFREAMGERRI